MKLILTQEVNGLGHPGDVVTVKDGFARNFLVPNGKAIAWSTGGEKQITSIRRARKAREIRDVEHAREIKATLEGADVKVGAKVGTAGRLFGSVTDKDVAQAVDRHRIKMAGHIKTLGRHSVKVTLLSNVVATVNIEVVPA
jgi:large subunit ribosomal protein L9